jgi:hypothetical protein
VEKIVVTILCFLLISACSSTKYVYQAPEFELPARPVLRDNDIDDARQIRNLELNYIDVIEYSLKLENILEEIKNKNNQEID